MTPALSVVVPVFDEQDNVAPLVGEIVAALRAHPVLEETRERARQWAGEAITALDGLPSGSVKESLVSFAQALVDRAS